MTTAEVLQYVPFVRVYLRVIDFWERKRGGGRSGPTTRIVGKRNLPLAIAIELVSLLALYLLLSPAFAMPLYNRIIFHPIPETDDLSDQIANIERAFNCKVHAVVFKAPDGAALHGWYFRIEGAPKTLLVSHGNGGCIKHRLPLCPLLLQSGCSVFLYDYEGFGDSTGSPSLQNSCDDAVAAFDFVTEDLKVKPQDVVLYGESIGAGVSSELCTQRKPGAVILQSPFTSMPDIGRDLIFFLKLYPDWTFPQPRLSNLEIMKGAHPPLLLIHGMKDAMLPLRYSQEIMANASEPKQLVVLPHAGHIDMYKVDVDVSIPALDNFIAQLPRSE